MAEDGAAVLLLGIRDHVRAVLVLEKLIQSMPQGRLEIGQLWVIDQVRHFTRIVHHVVELFRVSNAVILNELVIRRTDRERRRRVREIVFPVALVEKLLAPGPRHHFPGCRIPKG